MGFHVVKGVTRGTGGDVFQIVVENEVVIAGSPPRNVSLENVDFMGGLVLTVELFEFEVRMYGVEVRVCAIKWLHAVEPLYCGHHWAKKMCPH